MVTMRPRLPYLGAEGRLGEDPSGVFGPRHLLCHPESNVQWLGGEDSLLFQILAP